MFSRATYAALQEAIGINVPIIHYTENKKHQFLDRHHPHSLCAFRVTFFPQKIIKHLPNLHNAETEQSRNSPTWAKKPLLVNRNKQKCMWRICNRKVPIRPSPELSRLDSF